jgi:hypothetical protein
MLLRRARAEIAGEGPGGRGEGEIDGEANCEEEQKHAGAKFGNSEHVECGFRFRAGGGDDGGAHLGEEVGELGVDLGGGVKGEALEDQIDGVEGHGRDQDGEAGEQAETRSEVGGDAGEAEARAVDTEDDDGRGDEPEEREESDRREGEGEQGESSGESSGETCALDGSAPDDGIGGRRGLRNGLVREIGRSLLREDLLIDLFAQLFGELDLRSSAVPAEDERALVFAMENSVAAGAGARGHKYEG